MPKKDPTKKAWHRFPEAVHMVGHLSDFPRRVEVGRALHPDRPAAYDRDDPEVYLYCGRRGRKPPADLYYLEPFTIHASFRVYFKEVLDNG